MADFEVTGRADFSPIDRALQNTQNKVQTLGQKFDQLKGLISGLAIGAAIRSAINFADAMSDIAAETNVAVGTLLGFSQAVLLSGGDAEKANTAVQKLVQSIGEAATGSKTTQKAFKDVGVTIRDLETLSEGDILQKTIEGLGALEKKSATAAATIKKELFGKAFAGVSIGNVADQLGPAIKAQQDYARSVQKAAELQDKLDQAFFRLKTSVLQAIEPIANFVNQLKPEQIQSIVDSIVKLGSAFVVIGSSLVVLEKLAGVFVLIGGLVASTKVGFASIAAGFASISKTAQIAFSYVSRFFRVTPMFAEAGGVVARLGVLFSSLAARLPFLAAGLAAVAVGGAALIKPLLIVAAAIWGINEALKAFSGKGLLDWFDELVIKSEAFVTGNFPRIAAAIRSMREMMGMAPSPTAARDAEINAKYQEQVAQDMADSQKKLWKNQEKVRDVVNATAKAMAEFKNQQNQAFQTTREDLQLMQARYEFEKSLISVNGELLNLSEDQINEQRLLQALDEQRMQTIRGIKREIEGLQIAARFDEGGESLAKIKVLQEQINKINKEYEFQHNGIVGSFRALQAAQATAKILEEDRARTLENITNSMDKQVNRANALKTALLGVGDQIKQAQFEKGLIGKSPLETDLEKIKFDAQKAGEEALRAFAEGFDQEDATSAQIEEFLAGTERIKQQYLNLAKVQADNVKANYEYANSWAAGWKEAFDSYTKEAEGAANIAKNSFNAVSQNMNSAIDNFVQTGKFKFNDFATSVIKDLAAIQLKAAASQALGGLLNVVGTTVGKMFGFANGGTPPVNKPSIVGERGPELFIPKSAGTIVPNDKMGVNGTVNAPVNNTYITNNIQAVDAKSVAQLFAENRRTLLGTVRLAEKELSYR